MSMPGIKSPACIERCRWSKVWPQGDLKILHGESKKQKTKTYSILIDTLLVLSMV